MDQQDETAPEGPSGSRSATPGPAPRPAESVPALGPALLIYTLLRLMLIAALTAILATFMPFVVALMFAVILQLPLAWLLFGFQRRKVNAAMGRATAHRRSERDKLRSALAGDERDSGTVAGQNPGPERGSVGADGSGRGDSA